MLAAYFDRPVEPDARAMQLIAPKGAAGEALQLDITEIVNLGDMCHAAQPGVVWVFGPEASGLLEVWRMFPDFFSFKPVVLVNMPGAVTSPEFENATAGMKSVSYQSMVAELEAHALMDSAAKSEILRNGSIHEKEQALITRKNGSVKQFTGFSAPDMSSSFEEAEEGDDE